MIGIYRRKMIKTDFNKRIPVKKYIYIAVFSIVLWETREFLKQKMT